MLTREQRVAFCSWLVYDQGYSTVTAELYVDLTSGLLTAGAETGALLSSDILGQFAESTAGARRCAWSVYNRYRRPEGHGTCAWPHCLEVVTAQRLCLGHLITLHQAKQKATRCSSTGCGGESSVHGMCSRHFRAWSAGSRRVPNRVECREDGSALLWLTDRKGNEIKTAIVDQEDLPLLTPHRWSISYRGKNRPYVITQASTKGKKPRQVILLHRLIMGRDKDKEVDHINGDPFDNRKSNLRLVTHAEQNQNTVGRGSSGYRNVYPRGTKWLVSARKEGQTYRAGYFTSLEEAVQAAEQLRARIFTHHNEGRAGNKLPSAPRLSRFAVEFQGTIYPSLGALAQTLGVSYGSLRYRLSRGESLEKALSRPTTSPGRGRKSLD